MKSKIKRILSLILIAALIVTVNTGLSGATAVSAKKKKTTASESVNVYVTITDNTGKIAFRQSGVEVTDVDGDGALTINDALYIAHEKKYSGGAEAGYGYATSEWGLYVTKLWGDTSGWFGYYKNSGYVNGLSEPVAEGDFIDAFCYSDSKKHSDKYTFFNKRIIEVHRKEEFKLKLSYLAYDEDYNLVTGKVTKAVIIDGSNETEYKVNKKGVVTLSFDKIGSHFVTAASTKKKSVLVPPACIVYVIANKGNIITKDGVKYSVLEPGSILKNEKGVVTIKESDLPVGSDVPEEFEYGKVTYTVQIIDD